MRSLEWVRIFGQGKLHECLLYAEYLRSGAGVGVRAAGSGGRARRKKKQVRGERYNEGYFCALAATLISPNYANNELNGWHSWAATGAASSFWDYSATSEGNFVRPWWTDLINIFLKARCFEFFFTPSEETFLASFSCISRILVIQRSVSNLRWCIPDILCKKLFHVNRNSFLILNSIY